MKFIMVWRGQWMTTDEADRLKGEGAIMLTESRINTMLDKAAEQGIERGKQTGRYEMREDIEHGRIDPIKPLPDAQQGS